MAMQDDAIGRSTRIRDLGLCRNPPEFQMYNAPTRPATRWKSWLGYLENFFVLTEVTDPCTKRAMLLYLAGSELQELFDTLPDTGEDNDYEKATSALTAYFKSQINLDIEELTFRRAQQQKGETMHEFYTRLIGLASTCEFVDTMREIRMQIILGCRSNELRFEILCEKGITLKSILNAARAMEQAAEISAHLRRKLRLEEAAAQDRPLPSTLKELGSGPSTSDSERGRRARTQSKQCNNCGGSFPHRNQCPARGTSCENCGKMNHYAKVCQSRRQTHHQ